MGKKAAGQVVSGRIQDYNQIGDIMKETISVSIPGFKDEKYESCSAN